ncbi:TRAP transporter small permease [Sedimentitalea sp. XS_ASV28]|uniref:TRAP transporter small permease n=1 Tax=Sedimentitalea sp. XS_ASV28 TaxID=3241296 RepID=UPI0035171488
MNPFSYEPEGPLQQALYRGDHLNWNLAGIFLWLSNTCLLVMLGLTVATIILRPLSLAAYWMWPWTMVFFIWLSFFGFFAMYARLKDVRVDFIAGLFGPVGMAVTRVLTDIATLTVTGVLLWQVPQVIATSRGVYDGAILPAGFELPRLALSVPLFLSAALVAITALIDLAKMAAGLPENVADHHPET